MSVDFEKQSYWRDRFASEDAFEWLLSSAEFMTLLQPHLARLDASTARILHLGSGTSDLHNHLRARGFLNVANIDYEPLAVQRGRELEEREFGDVRTSYAVADVTQPSQPLIEPKYDLVVDKSTADAVACAGAQAVRRMVDSVRAALAPRAVWISLSYSSSRFDFDGMPFDVQVLAKVPTPKLKPSDPDVFHWCYLLTPK